MSDLRTEAIICPRCFEMDEKSRATERYGAVTLMAWHPYYDEEGRYHAHDPNRQARDFSCSRGHEWSVPIRCWCGPGT